MKVAEYNRNVGNVFIVHNLYLKHQSNIYLYFLEFTFVSNNCFTGPCMGIPVAPEGLS